MKIREAIESDAQLMIDLFEKLDSETSFMMMEPGERNVSVEDQVKRICAFANERVAVASGLFDIGDIKVRINPYQQYSVGGKREPFIHVFSSIMQGRTTEQRAKLSQSVVEKLVDMFPHVPNIAMNVSEFEKATYCNRNML